MQWQSLYEGLGDEPFKEPSSVLSDIPFHGSSTEQTSFFNPVLSMNGINVSPDSIPASRLEELNPNVSSEGMFPMSGISAMVPSFVATDIHRSTSQPAKARRNFSPGDFSMSHNSRDTLYAHEFLKAFRARAPESNDRQAACDYCRKRKIKVRQIVLLTIVRSKETNMWKLCPSWAHMYQ